MNSKVYLNSIATTDEDEIADFIVTGLNKIGEVFPGKPGDKILIKPNFVIGIKGFELACTGKEVLKAVFSLAKDMNLRIYLGESPAFGSVKGICELLDIKDMLGYYDVEIVDFKKGTSLDMKIGGKNIPLLTIPAGINEFDHIINIPKAKSHLQMSYTGAVKNHFGFICGKNKPFIHCMVKNDKITFAKILINLCKEIKCDLHILDGIKAMDGNGGIRGNEYRLNKILISKDPLALDHVFSEIITVPPEENHLIRAAKELGESAAYLENIALLGELLETSRVNDFSFPKFRNISFNPLHLIKSVSKSVVYKVRGA